MPFLFGHGRESTDGLPTNIKNIVNGILASARTLNITIIAISTYNNSSPPANPQTGSHVIFARPTRKNDAIIYTVEGHDKDMEALAVMALTFRRGYRKFVRNLGNGPEDEEKFWEHLGTGEKKKVHVFDDTEERHFNELDKEA